MIIRKNKFRKNSLFFEDDNEEERMDIDGEEINNIFDIWHDRRYGGIVYCDRKKSIKHL